MSAPPAAAIIAPDFERWERPYAASSAPPKAEASRSVSERLIVVALISHFSLLTRRPRFRQAAMRFGEDARWRHARDRRSHLVHPAGHDFALAVHHGVEALHRDVGGVHLLLLADLCVHQVRTFEELGFRGARH